MTIVASGGVMRPLVGYLLELTGKEDPAVCFLGTATGEASVPGFYEATYRLFHIDSTSGRYGCWSSSNRWATSSSLASARSA